MIITHTKGSVTPSAYLNRFPDQFVDDDKKTKDESYIKETMDYFANVAFSQYNRNVRTFVKNYDLMKGIITYDDFYRENPEVRSFVDLLQSDVELPSYVKHYPIINPPINTAVGELGKRPDGRRVRAFDDDSRSEEMDNKTNKIQEFILQEGSRRVLQKAAAKGLRLTEEEHEQMTLEEVQDYLTDYTSIGEEWGNHTITAMKRELEMKDKGEDAFRDLLTGGRESFHIYEDSSKRGFDIEVANPKNVWKLTTPDKKYHRDAYAIGLVQVMEISEIIEKVPEITKKEIDHLRQSSNDFGVLNVRESNLFTKDVGINSIKYDTYDPLLLQERMLMESALKDNSDELRDWLGVSTNVGTFGYKYTVVTAYWISKKKVGKLTYMDEDGNPQVTLVDEHYKEGGPGEIDIEWGWVNQWFKGRKVGPDVYHMAPFKLLDYSPIIGVSYEQKNTEVKSLVDMMKPYQAIYNVCMNQLWRLLEKEIGNVGYVNIRRVPKPKDGDGQDAIEIWEEEARTRGIMFDDDSPDNTKGATSNTSVGKNIDLTRTNEIQSRYNTAIQMKLECWELVGMNRQRLGASLSTETATANQSDLTQSFAQTEPYFAQHEYVMDQVYQAILDTAQYIESTKPFSTMNYLTNEGESAFIRITGSDIKSKDLHILNTTNPEDQALFREIRALSQPMLQNGATEYDIIGMYTTNSMRQMKKIAKTMKDKKEELIAYQQQMEQATLQQEKEIAQAQLQQADEQHQVDIINENYNKEQDRLSKERIAIITATGFGKVASEDVNGDMIPDVLEASKLSNEIVTSQRDYQLKLRELSQKEKELRDRRDIELEKLQVARENQKNDLAIAAKNAQGRKAKAKTTKKKK